METDEPAEYAEPVLSDDVLDKLALLAVEKWTPGQDIEVIAEEVRDAYSEAKSRIADMNPEGVLYFTVS